MSAQEDQPTTDESTTDGQPASVEPPAPVAVRIRQLTKVYGAQTALRNLSLTIPQGDIFGYIGPNGAGKTTTIRILATLLRPTSGTAEIHGVSVLEDPLEIKPLVGYMPDTFGVYENMSLLEYLDFFGAAFRIPRGKRRRIIDDVLALTDLGSKRNDEVHSFSRGMQQRACLAKTLLHDPRVLILDEPASGLDPRARIEFRELLRELQKMGKTIVVSSHILSELSSICNSVGIIEKGNLVVSGSVEDILKNLRSNRRFVLSPLHPPDRVEALRLLNDLPGVREVKEFGGAVAINLDATDEEVATILEELGRAAVRYTEFREEHVDLETAFMTLTRGDLG